MPHRRPFTIVPPRPQPRRGRWRGVGVAMLGGIAAGLALSGAVTGGLVEPRAAGAVPIARAGATTVSGVRFGRCPTGGGENCVVDGDTIRVGGERVRLLDIDTPETHPPRCAAEAAAGERATARLQELLNAGPVTLVAGERDTDRYGRKLRRVERDGVSLGEMLVGEGLARRYEGGRRGGWCGARSGSA